MALEVSLEVSYWFKEAEMRREGIPGMGNSLSKGMNVGDEISCIGNHK